MVSAAAFVLLHLSVNNLRFFDFNRAFLDRAVGLFITTESIALILQIILLSHYQGLFHVFLFF
jgi:hypothetical protein